MILKAVDATKDTALMQEAKDAGCDVPAEGTKMTIRDSDGVDRQKTLSKISVVKDESGKIVGVQCDWI